jgi:uncharacterized protein (TIGR03089 family)
VSPPTATPGSLLAAALRADPARPLLTFTDDSTGERTELSVATFANWVAKTANLLQDEVGPGPDDVVALDLPVHWQAAVWLQACWAAGQPVGLGPVTGEEAAAVLAHDGSRAGRGPVPATVTVVSLGLGPLGLPRPGVLPAYDHALDYDREVHGHGDRFTPVAPPRADDGALVVGGTALTHAELGALATSATPPGGALLVSAPLVDLRAVLATVLVPLATGGRVLLCRNLELLDAARLAGRVAQEGVVAAVRAANDTPLGERTVTAGLPEWSSPGAGMA